MRKRKVLALAVIAAVVAVPSAQAHNGDGSGGWKVVASGLDNPRGISIAKNGDLWIAEAGRGGTRAPRQQRQGARQLRPGRGRPDAVVLRPQRRVHAASTRLAEARRHRPAVDRRRGHGRQRHRRERHRRPTAKHVTGLVGGGGGSAERAVLAPRARRALGHDAQDRSVEWRRPAVRRLRGRTRRPTTPTRARSTPTRTASHERQGGFVVADAAGNDVLGVDYHKHISTLAVFPDVLVAAPPFLGLPPGRR